MLEIYSENVTVVANEAVPFNNVSLEKGCTAQLSGASNIQLNKCGVYMVSVDASAEDPVTLQLYKNGVAQPQAQSTGDAPAFVTLVQVDKNNTCCACSSPVSLQIISADAGTLTNVNCVITKIV